MAPQAFGWSALGHEVAGELTAAYLSEETEIEVRRLLGRETLASASTWADRMRDNPAKFWQEEASAYHYVNMPIGSRYTIGRAPRQGDAFTALRMFRKELRSPDTPLERRRLALRFAMHIIQDLQQPLHAGSGRDRGGNDVTVSVGRERTNLHRVWDYHIVAHADRNRRQWVQYLRGNMPSDGSADTDPVTWINESSALCEALYPPPRRVDAAYLDRYLPIAEERLALAARRTAAWLNETFEGATDEPPEATPATAEERSWWQRLLGT